MLTSHKWEKSSHDTSNMEKARGYHNALFWSEVTPPIRSAEKWVWQIASGYPVVSEDQKLRGTSLFASSSTGSGHCIGSMLAKRSSNLSLEPKQNVWIFSGVSVNFKAYVAYFLVSSQHIRNMAATVLSWSNHNEHLCTKLGGATQCYFTCSATDLCSK